MNRLSIPFFNAGSDIAFDELNALLDSLQCHDIGNLLWSNNGYKPKVSFAIAHNGQNIFLKYRVFEDGINAIYRHANDPVYKDTCVEFFISFGDVYYYNLEFNRLGVCLTAYGVKNPGRESIADKEIEKIRSNTTLQNCSGEFLHRWELTLIIPVTVFVKHPEMDLNGITCTGNFYKCGDDLPNPHFLAWNNIDSPEPNFHLPQFFGQLQFEKETQL